MARAWIVPFALLIAASDFTRSEDSRRKNHHLRSTNRSRWLGLDRQVEENSSHGFGAGSRSRGDQHSHADDRALENIFTATRKGEGGKKGDKRKGKGKAKAFSPPTAASKFERGNIDTNTRIRPSSPPADSRFSLPDTPDPQRSSTNGLEIQQAQEPCTLSPEGMYGDTDAGILYNDVTYFYQTTVVQGTDPNIVARNVLPDIDRAVPQGLIPSFFPECGGRRRLQGSSGVVNSISSRPVDDIVVQGLSCLKEDASDCYVFTGSLTLTGTNFRSRTQVEDLVRVEVQKLLQSGFVASSNPLITDVEYLTPDFETVNPIPTSSPVEGGIRPNPTPAPNSEPTTNAPTPSDTPAPFGTNPTTPSPDTGVAPSLASAVPSPSPNDAPTPSGPTTRSEGDDDSGLEWWAWLLIGAGAAALALPFLLGGGNRGASAPLASAENAKDDAADEEYVAPGMENNPYGEIQAQVEPPVLASSPVVEPLRSVAENQMPPGYFKEGDEEDGRDNEGVQAEYRDEEGDEQEDEDEDEDEDEEGSQEEDEENAEEGEQGEYPSSEDPTGEDEEEAEGDETFEEESYYEEEEITTENDSFK